MYIMQEVYYTTTGKFKFVKRLDILYYIAPNKSRYIVGVYKQQDVRPKTIQWINLPSIEVTPSQYRWFEKYKIETTMIPQ